VRTNLQFKLVLLGLVPVALFACTVLQAAERFTITIHNEGSLARPAETIVVPFAEVKKRLPGVMFDQVIVRDTKGKVVPSQVTAMRHSHKGPQEYDDLVFQHDFSATEKSAIFTVETVASPSPPLPSKVFARVVPERFDDFAWENDKVAHRAYGPGLELPTATKDQMTSSGIDLWAKKVPYLIVDRWYHKGHDGLHSDTGEGLDFYDVGTSRGVGGTGVWDGQKLSVSKNWRGWAVYANGPVRAIFDLSYEPWDAGNGVQVKEIKRFVVDAGRYLDEITSRFDFTPAPGSDGTITVAIGLNEHPSKASVAPAQDERGRWISLWEKYQAPEDGELGTGIIVAPEANFAGFARTQRPESLVLLKVKPGETVRYFAGGGWNKARDFTTAQQWNAYLSAWAARLAKPVRVELSGGS
jgi:Domain of unknown function (DUF4861)